MTVAVCAQTLNPRWLVAVAVMMSILAEVVTLSGPHVCMVKQKYNITKRVKYRAPMAIRSYEWCFAVPPRCSKWTTELRDLTRLETEERIAEMAACCPGYKMKDISCVPICPNGKTGQGCSEDCPPNMWGPNCVHECKRCWHGVCSPTTGECDCQDGWQGESCEISMTTTPSLMDQLLTTTKKESSTKYTEPSSTPRITTKTTLSTPSTTSTTVETTTKTITQTTAAITKKPEIVTPNPITKDVEIKTDLSLNFSNATITSPFTTIKPAREEHSLFEESIVKKTDMPRQNTKQTSVETATNTSIATTARSTVMTTSPITTTAVTLPATSKIITTLLITEPTTSVKLTTAVKIETTRKLETTIRLPTSKTKPKEIWIRPAQKGETSTIDIKTKSTQELTKHKTVHKKESTENTTPKTIIVSIIPTSVSYVTFKKIALTTISYGSQKNTAVKNNTRTTVQGITKPMIAQTTATPYTTKVNSMSKKLSVQTVDSILQNVTKLQFLTSFTTETSKITLKQTNSMISTLNESNNKTLNSHNVITTTSSSTNAYRTTRGINETSLKENTQSNDTIKQMRTTEHPIGNSHFFIKHSTIINKITEPPINKTFVRKQVETNANSTNFINVTVTAKPKDEETFNILTEPEHITAVMSDKGSNKSSVDLISVISIAGGVMMAIITVAVVIVMLERCKKPAYEDVRKFNDIRMQAVIANDDVRPPYVRSIFHTPLPDPPKSEKCHYQPISTLDRNLKQFMRPVVVQTISPLMLENFRGILECHYDHLPRRSHDLQNMNNRCSATPSMQECQELLQHRPYSPTVSTIDAMKCEARLDVIDNTTSEPLYAEIPCWRPPSEHAIEIVNLNGEAVTEL